jgi:hypothetical protein
MRCSPSSSRRPSIQGNSRASYSMLLAFAAYVELAPEEFISLIEMARIAPSINEGANAVLASLRENLGEMP